MRMLAYYVVGDEGGDVASQQGREGSRFRFPTTKRVVAAHSLLLFLGGGVGYLGGAEGKRSRCRQG